MELYGGVQKSNYTFGRWYLELPEIWSRDKEYIKSTPYPCMDTTFKPKMSPELFDFYKLEADWMDFSRVFDLRGGYWRDKLLTFIMNFGRGWVSKGGIITDESPLEHLMFLGNYNVLASRNYLWSVIKHRPNEKDEFVELWYYVSTFEHPENFYTLTKLDSQEFLNG